MNSNMESKLMLNKLLATERNPERNRLNVTYVIIAVLKKVPTIPESTDSWIYGFLNLRIIETMTPELSQYWVEYALILWIPEPTDSWSYDSWIYEFLKLLFLNLRIPETTIPESTDSWIYQQHVVSVHEGKKPFKCDICDFSCSLRHNMKRHVALVHEENNPFKCDICDFSSAQRNVLKVNVASVHEGDKPFNCDICNYCLSKRDKLKRRVASVHEEKKPFKCDIYVKSTCCISSWRR